MRIEIHTSNPALLWDKIKKEVKNEKIKTWSVVIATNKKEYLKHKPEQWFKKALLESSIATIPDRLIMTVTWYENSEPTEYIKGLYIGRFTEELLEHYRKDFSKLETFV